MFLRSSAQKVQDLLLEQGYAGTVVELTDSTRTAQEAANAVGCTVGQIAKSLIFRGENSGQPILVITSGANRVNEKKIAALVGEPIGKASADFVREKTGFAIGGVPPIGHSHPLLTFIDADLGQYSEIWAAAGTPFAVFQLTPAQLLEMTNGHLITVK